MRTSSPRPRKVLTNGADQRHDGLGRLHRRRITQSRPTIPGYSHRVERHSMEASVQGRTPMLTHRHARMSAFILSVNIRMTIPTAGGVADSGERGARKPPLVPSSNPAGVTSKTLMIPTRLRPGRGEGFSDFRGHAAGRVFLASFTCSAVVWMPPFWRRFTSFSMPSVTTVCKMRHCEQDLTSLVAEQD